MATPVRRILICRVTWMQRYAGFVAGDKQSGGGDYVESGGTGHELYNFADRSGRVRGFIQTVQTGDNDSSAIKLRRIDAGAGETPNLANVLVVFVATSPKPRHQVVVGWYRNARVRAFPVRDSKYRIDGKGGWVHAEAKTGDAVLLPPDRRTQVVASGKGGLGQAGVWYALTEKCEPKPVPEWFTSMLGFVDRYEGPNLMREPLAPEEERFASILDGVHGATEGAGFMPSPKQRVAIEAHAMARAKKYFSQHFPVVDDVSKYKSYDLECSGKGSLKVEVKGTTSLGSSVFVTRNEVDLARKGKVAMFVLHSIQRNKQGRPVGGKHLVLKHWWAEKGQLRPITYQLVFA